MEDRTKRTVFLVGGCVVSLGLGYAIATSVHAPSGAEKQAAAVSTSATPSAAPATSPSADAAPPASQSTAASAAEPTPAPEAGPVMSDLNRTFGPWQTADCSKVDQNAALRLFRLMVPKKDGGTAITLDCRKPGQNWTDVWGGNGVLPEDKLREPSATFDVCSCRYHPDPDDVDRDVNARYQPSE